MGGGGRTRAVAARQGGSRPPPQRERQVEHGAGGQRGGPAEGRTGGGDLTARGVGQDQPQVRPQRGEVGAHVAVDPDGRGMDAVAAPRGPARTLGACPDHRRPGAACAGDRGFLPVPVPGLGGRTPAGGDPLHGAAGRSRSVGSSAAEPRGLRDAPMAAAPPSTAASGTPRRCRGRRARLAGPFTGRADGMNPALPLYAWRPWGSPRAWSTQCSDVDRVHRLPLPTAPRRREHPRQDGVVTGRTAAQAPADRVRVRAYEPQLPRGLVDLGRVPRSPGSAPAVAVSVAERIRGTTRRCKDRGTSITRRE